MITLLPEDKERLLKILDFELAKLDHNLTHFRSKATKGLIGRWDERRLQLKRIYKFTKSI